MKTNSKTLKLLCMTLSLLGATAAQAMVKVVKIDKNCLSHHISTHNNRMAKLVMNRHSSETLNNDSFFSEKRLPLHTAVETANTEMIPDLIRAGADPNVANSDNLTPVKIAAMKRNIPMMQILVDNGATFDADTKNFALTVVDDNRQRLLWPGVEFNQAGLGEEERINIVKQHIHAISPKK